MFSHSCSATVCVTEVTQSVRIPVLIGSGVTHDNVEHYLQASAMIIGSHFKKGGYWGEWCGCWESQKVHGEDAWTSGVTEVVLVQIVQK